MVGSVINTGPPAKTETADATECPFVPPPTETKRNGRLLHLSSNVNETDYYVSAGNIWCFFGIAIDFGSYSNFREVRRLRFVTPALNYLLLLFFPSAHPKPSHIRDSSSSQFIGTPQNDIAKQPPPERLTGIQTWSRLILIELWD